MQARDRVLIVEDEVFIALDLADIVEGAGYVVDGPYGTVQETIKAIERSMPRCAILDVQLMDGEVYPVADILAQCDVPLIFHSGHADTSELRARYPRAMACPKPSTSRSISEALDSIIAQ